MTEPTTPAPPPAAEYVERLRELAGADTELAHCEGDRVLCDLLRRLGYGAVADEWERLPKWYS